MYLARKIFKTVKRTVLNTVILPLDPEERFPYFELKKIPEDWLNRSKHYDSTDGCLFENVLSMQHYRKGGSMRIDNFIYSSFKPSYLVVHQSKYHAGWRKVIKDFK